MMMIATSRIELRATTRAARITPHVLENGQNCAAGAAKYRFVAPFTLWPHLDLVIGKRAVAILARIIDATTFHLDGDDVTGPPIVYAARLRIDFYSSHLSNRWGHCASNQRKNFNRIGRECNRIKLKRRLVWPPDFSHIF
jgi:hypothetical protein